MAKGRRKPVVPVRREYDFSKGKRGKYAKRAASGTNVIVLDPDVARMFSNPETVNSLLRELGELIRKQAREA